ncbi:MAG: RNA polymerase sigma factor SigF [Chroococcus sp. CMT-3BRIN-NPC107]|jgi:RNA polymerase sigma-B factor|nr:RNA polymerase sigma factor SigF [Chroococcus sp. CMT-3BRIN-NPC107]
MAVTQSCIKSDGIELLVAYYQNPSVQLRNKLVNLHTGLVRKIAHQFSHQCTEPYEDLEQIGYLGLIRAIERFNPKQGYAFSSFAVPYIRGEIMHFLRDRAGLVKIPRRWQEVYTQGQKVRKELTITLGRCPTDTELARQLNVSVQEWYDSNLAAQNRMAISLDSTVVQNVDCALTLGDILPDSKATNMQQQAEDREQLQGAMNQLEESTRTAVEFVFLKELSRKEAAKRIGISPMTVTRYLQRGKEQLVSLLQPQMMQTRA